MAQRQSVPGLVGREFIFFTAAHMVLCFGFMTKKALVTHQCIGYG